MFKCHCEKPKATKQSLIGLILFILFMVTHCPAICHAQHEHPSHQLVLYSKTQTIDGIYHSMTGPQDNEPFVFIKNEKPQLLWLTGFKIEVIDPKTNVLQSPEYLCHSHVRFNTKIFDINKRDPALDPGLNHDIKLVTLIQGRTEINFPKDFALPIFSNEPFIFHSMIINNNRIDKPFELQAKATFTYFKDNELTAPMKPLFRRCLTLRVPVDTSNKGNKHLNCLCELGMVEDRELDSGPIPSAQAVKSTRGNTSKDSSGQDIVFHWFVPPGRHLYRYNVGQLGIPYDTTAHYIAIHIHPYGTFCELRDLTTKKNIFKSVSTNFKDRIGVEKSEMYSSPIGIPVFKNHQYEIICGYNNTTHQDIDAMAVMYIYLLNKNFEVAKRA